MSYATYNYNVNIWEIYTYDPEIQDRAADLLMQSEVTDSDKDFDQTTSWSNTITGAPVSIECNSK